MGRTVVTLLFFAALGVGAVFVAKRFVNPARDQAQASQKVLTHAYQPKFLECRVLEDSEIPASLPRPGVDEDLVYVEVVVLYPGVERVPDPGDHRLIGVNGESMSLDPADTEYAVTEEGAELTLIFRTNNSFSFGRLVRGDKVLFERVELE